jgi:hypothetical protein
MPRLATVPSAMDTTTVRCPASRHLLNSSGGHEKKPAHHRPAAAAPSIILFFRKNHPSFPPTHPWQVGAGTARQHPTGSRTAADEAIPSPRLAGVARGSLGFSPQLHAPTTADSLSVFHCSPRARQRLLVTNSTAASARCWMGNQRLAAARPCMHVQASTGGWEHDVRQLYPAIEWWLLASPGP